MKSQAARKVALYKIVSKHSNSILVNSSFSSQFDLLPVLRFLQFQPSTQSTDLHNENNDGFIDFSSMKNSKEVRECLEKVDAGRSLDLEETSKSIVLENINHLFFILPLQDWFPLLKQFLALCNRKVIILFKNDLNVHVDKRFEISYLAILKDLTQLHVELYKGSKDEALGSCSLFLKKLSGKVERSSFDYTLDTDGKVSVYETSKDDRVCIIYFNNLFIIRDQFNKQRRTNLLSLLPQTSHLTCRLVIRKNPKKKPLFCRTQWKLNP